MKSLLVTLGSAGDVHPYVAIGVELRRRGHEVTVLTNPHFERRIVEAGLAFRGVGTEEDYLRVLLHPDLVHAHKSPGLVVRELMAATLGPLWEETRTALAEIRPDVMLRHHICFSARWAAEEAGVPCATGVLSPLFFFGAEDPGVYHPWMPEHPPGWMNWLRRVTTRRLLRWRLDRPMNAALRERGLPSRRDLFLTECTSGPVLGLWSPTFRAAMADDPPGSSVCGFCFFDRGGQWEERGEGGGQRGLAALREFLDACEARGEAPVLVTLGSSVVHHGRSVYAIAAEVLAEMRVPGVLLCGDEVVEGPGVRGFAYAPYSMVMPRARAVIHHGGVGTTAQGLLSGRPTVILPHANDAFDNAARAARLGCSITVKPGGLSVKRLGEAVRRVTTEASFAARAREVSLAMRGEDGAARAADQLERLAG